MRQVQTNNPMHEDKIIVYRPDGSSYVPKVHLVGSSTEPEGDNPYAQLEEEDEKNNTNGAFITLDTLALVAGIVFWVHGNKTHDAWFKDEAYVGMIITIVLAALTGAFCACVCIGGSCAAIAGDAENNKVGNDVVQARNDLNVAQNKPSLLVLFSSLFVDAKKQEEKTSNITCEI